MFGELMSDPKVRSAYVATKVGVVAIAAVATLPLAKVFGSRAWVGFGVFAGLMAVLTVVVLASARPKADDGVAAPGPKDEDEEAEPDPELAVVLPVEDWIDLHSFPPRDIPDVVSDYLAEAHAAGFREVRLIHGRGIGVQRERVQSLLKRHPLVGAFRDAPPERGGWGATVAELRDEPLEPD
jgi:hypothetical protein